MADKKIIIYGKHFATIDSNLWEKLISFINVDNLTHFIKFNVLKDFGINIQGSEDVEKLDEILPQFYYSSKKEWLNDKMRTIITEQEFKENAGRGNEILNYIIQIPQSDVIISSPTLTKDFVLECVQKKGMIKRIERNFQRIEEGNGERPKTIVIPLFSVVVYYYNQLYMHEDEGKVIYNALVNTEYYKEALKIPAFLSLVEDNSYKFKEKDLDFSEEMMDFYK